MKLIRDLDELSTVPRHGAVSIGNFDGVHRGHARIIERLVAQAGELAGPATVFTFDPHPAKLLQPGAGPPQLTWLKRKAELLGQLNVDCVIAYPTDHNILNLSPRDFFEQILQQQLAAQAVVEGPNFFFGRNRSGSVNRLAELCHQAEMSLDVVEPLRIDGEIVSSSRIRGLLQAGRLAEANRLLTQPYRICGPIVRGAGRGATIGFPTANIDPADSVLPPVAVYAGRAIVAGTSYPAAINIGPNPTFGEQQLKIETFLIEFTGQIYDQLLEIEFLAKLRDTRPFDSVESLTQQLAADVEAARHLATNGAPPAANGPSC